MPMRFFYAIGFIVLVSVIMNIRNRRRQAATWSGVVTEVRCRSGGAARDEDRRQDEWVTILCQTDAGRAEKVKVRMGIYRQLFPGLEPGERLHKKPGQYLPRREQALCPGDESCSNDERCPGAERTEPAESA